MRNDLPPIPEGWKRTSGKRAPSGAKWHIMLRNGFADTRIAYEPQQLRWVHEGHCGDVVAVKQAK